MSSPIHKYLFSPPPSPPTRSNDWAVRKPSLTPIKLVSELLPNARTFDAERGEMKPRSPRTPQQRQFTLDNTYPSPYPSSPAIVIDEVGGTPGSATPKASAIGPSTPKRRTKGDKEKIASPPYLPANVPSSPIPIPSALPRPLVRLMVFASLVLSCILMLVFVPSARLPSLHSASVSRRLKLAPDGRAYLDVVRGANSWEDARDRDYQPPQIRVKQMSKRVPSREKRAVPPPAASRREPRPVPSSHEFLALQSYLLQSSYHTLPHTLDPSQPLDAHIMFGLSHHHLGEPGSPKETALFSELEKERESDVVVWYGSDGKPQVPHYLLDAMAKIHDKHRHPVLMPCHGRNDLPLLTAVLARLGLPTDQPVVMIGNKPVVATPENVQTMVENGSLKEMLREIGWVRPEKTAKKPKLAVLKKKSVTAHDALEAMIL